MNDPIEHEQINSGPHRNIPDASDENETQEVMAKGKGFFIINICVIWRIVALGGGFEEVAAYLVLVRGSGRNREVSTHGASSIAVRSGMTHGMAEKSLKWLQDHKVIAKVEEVGDELPKKRKPRYRLLKVQDVQVKEVALANDLLDGVGRGKTKPPLVRIYNEVKMGPTQMIADSRLDALMLLLNLYLHHELADYGGVNPGAGLYSQYSLTENSYGNLVEPVEGTNLALFEIQVSNVISYRGFSREALFYVLEEQQHKGRFICAFENLKRLGFHYETIQIWSADPGKNKNARPLYTLYIKDRHARESEPYLSTVIHSLAMRKQILNPYDEFVVPDEETVMNIINSGRFRFVANSATGGYAIGIWRLRFRPHTRDTGKGIQAEQQRVNGWESLLNSL